MSAEPFVDDTPSYVQESFEMIRSVRERLSNLVSELDEVLGTAREVVELQVVKDEEGIPMECRYCSEPYVEKRSSEMPCYGYHTKECFVSDQGSGEVE